MGKLIRYGILLSSMAGMAPIVFAEIYLGGGLVVANSDFDLMASSQWRNFAEDNDAQEQGFSFFTGYKLNNHLSFEVSYNDYGTDYERRFDSFDSTLAQDFEFKGQSVALLSILSWPITPTISLFSVVGMEQLKVDVDTLMSGLEVGEQKYLLSNTDRANSLYLGAGVSFDFHNRISIRTMFNRRSWDIEVDKSAVEFNLGSFVIDAAYTFDD